jgi:hypothetical protein
VCRRWIIWWLQVVAVVAVLLTALAVVRVDLELARHFL